MKLHLMPTRNVPCGTPRPPGYLRQGGRSRLDPLRSRGYAPSQGKCGRAPDEPGSHKTRNRVR
jgi:hypothetical protein